MKAPAWYKVRSFTATSGGFCRFLMTFGEEDVYEDEFCEAPSDDSWKQIGGSFYSNLTSTSKNRFDFCQRCQEGVSSTIYNDYVLGSSIPIGSKDYDTKTVSSISDTDSILKERRL